MITNYEQLLENEKIIREICRLYRKELTDFSGRICEQAGVCSKEEYINFMNELCFDEFVGNQLSGVANEMLIDDYKDVLDGDITIEEILKDYGSFFEAYFEE